MVDPGESVSITLQREFMEEALNAPEFASLTKEEKLAKLKDLFFSADREVRYERLVFLYFSIFQLLIYNSGYVAVGITKWRI